LRRLFYVAHCSGCGSIREPFRDFWLDSGEGCPNCPALNAWVECHDEHHDLWFYFWYSSIGGPITFSELRTLLFGRKAKQAAKTPPMGNSMRPIRLSRIVSAVKHWWSLEW